MGADGAPLARSNWEEREAFLAHVSEHRAPRFAAHWTFMLEPLVPDHSDRPGALRYRQIEYYRMPMMAFLALDGLDGLTRADYVRLTHASAPGDPKALPFTESYLADLQARAIASKECVAAGGGDALRPIAQNSPIKVIPAPAG